MQQKKKKSVVRQVVFILISKFVLKIAILNQLIIHVIIHIKHFQIAQSSNLSRFLSFN